MKKIICVTICLITIINLLSLTAFAADSSDPSVAPCFNNTSITSNNFYITPEGVAQISVTYSGYPEITTGATITIKLQKKFLLFFWQDVEEWVDVAEGTYYSNIHTKQLTAKGTYKAIIQYEVRGTAGPADIIESELEQKYD